MVAPTSWALVNIAIENVQNLSFGSFVAGNGGSVTVSANGNRSAGGGVVLIPSSLGTAAQFTVSGDPNATYTIQLPVNDVVSLTGPGNGMFVNTFTSTPSGAGGNLGAGGSQALSVGGTLNVGSDQAPGSYSSTFSVTVSYN
jgi:spore coat protein U-like protein